MEQYKKLILKRDALNKEAFLYQQEYYRTFYTVLTSIYTKQFETICLNKAIEFCQNQTEDLIAKWELKEYVKNETRSDLEHFNKMLDTLKNANTYSKISSYDYKSIEYIYQDIRMHTLNNDCLDKAYLAYVNNDLEMLSQIQSQLKEESIQFDEDIDILQKDIETIQNTIPYQYKYILSSPEQRLLYEDNLYEEIEELDIYIEELKKELERYPIIQALH